MRRLLLLALLLAALPVAAQDIVELDGQPAIRFAVGHGHLQTYCEGELLVSETRVAYRSVTTPEHSFNVARTEVHDAHAGGSLGFNYIKMEVGGKGTYRFGVFPDVLKKIPNRFEFVAQAINNPAAAFPEVRRLLKERRSEPAQVRYVPTAAGDTLEFTGGLYRGVAYLPGIKKAPVFDPPESGYRGVAPQYTGTFIVTPTSVKFRAVGGQEFNSAKSDLTQLFAAAGLPMAIYRDKDGIANTFYFGQVTAGNVELGESALFLAAMEEEGFRKIVAVLNPKGTLVVSGAPPGAELFVNETSRGTFDANGKLLVPDLAPGDYSLRVTKEKYVAWTGSATLKAGEITTLPVALKEEPQGLAESEIEDALKNGMPPARVAEKVKEFGVSFKLTDEIEGRLRKAGADENLLLAIARAQH